MTSHQSWLRSQQQATSSLSQESVMVRWLRVTILEEESGVQGWSVRQRLWKCVRE